MTTEAEIHLLRQRLAELESTVTLIDKGQQKYERKQWDEDMRAALTGVFSGLTETVSMSQVVNRAFAFADECTRQRREKQ